LFIISEISQWLPLFQKEDQNKKHTDREKNVPACLFADKAAKAKRKEKEEGNDNNHKEKEENDSNHKQQTSLTKILVVVFAILKRRKAHSLSVKQQMRISS
jgi:hypothetical protein